MAILTLISFEYDLDKGCKEGAYAISTQKNARPMAKASEFRT